jgi:hypothetical protein
MKKQLKDLNISIPVIDVLESRKLFGGNGGYGDPPLDGGTIDEVVVKPDSPSDGGQDPYPDDDLYSSDDPENDSDTNDADGLSSDNGEPRTVANGECVIGAIEEAIRHLGKSLDPGKVKEYLDKNYEKSEGGYKLNSSDFEKICEYFFEGASAKDTSALYEAFDNGQYAVARVDLDNNDTLEHAVVLTGVDEDDINKFTYWDPVTGETGTIDKWDVWDSWVVTDLK